MASATLDQVVRRVLPGSLISPPQGPVAGFSSALSAY
jgi:hypothetical protein